ncbi:MAG: hypothetical protein ACRD2C_24990 [Acidimicrobiales bacterium]
MAWQRGRRAAAAGALVTVVTLSFAACGDDDDASSGESSAGDQSDETTTTEATSTTLTEEEQVLADYEAAREAIYAAYDPPDPTHPDLVARVDGEALGATQNAVGMAQADGISYTGPFELDPVFINMSGDEAVVEDCPSEHTQRVNTQTGEPIGEPIDQVNHQRIDLQRIDGVWKIVRVQELEEPCTT